MHDQAIAEEDRTTPVVPAIRPTMPWRVEHVSAMPHRRLSVVFLDGLTGTVDLSALIESPQAGVFGAARRRGLFRGPSSPTVRYVARRPRPGA